MAQAIMRRRKANAKYAVEVGTKWILTDSSGTFKVPASGNYQVEIHGGGGGGRMTLQTGYDSIYDVCGGGGSGEVYTAEFTRGDIISYTVGKGGTGVKNAVPTDGEGSTFGDLAIDGGGGGLPARLSGSYEYIPRPNAVGSLATDGAYVSGTGKAQGGYGNKNKPTQTYGNGGSAGGSLTSFNGKDGGIIVTYLGKE